MSKHTLIKNATLVNEGETRQADVRIEGAHIGEIGTDLPTTETSKVIDAQGLILLPGMIDDQVHFREPGLTHKGDLHTESRAAVAGGITSTMEMPNTSPPTTNADAIRDKLARARDRSYTNYAFYLGATNDNLEDVRSIDPTLVCGTKVFMGASTGNMLVDDPDILEKIFAHCPTLIATHCEDTPMIAANTVKMQQQYGDDIPARLHPLIRSREACLKSSTMAVKLARENHARLHVLHLTTAEEMALFEPGPIADKAITAEVCAHHLWFSDEDYEHLGHRIKCNPAIKSALDRDALWQSLKEDRIDIIATDHAPHTRAEKETDYIHAAAGMPLVQDALLSVLESVHDQRLSLTQVVQKTAHNVAQRFDVIDRGFIRPGCFADLVLVDMQQATAATDANALYKCGWTPFNGVNFRSRILKTWVNGVNVYDEGTFTTDPCGQPLKFDR